MALPVVALNRQDVKIAIKFKKLTKLIQSYDDTGATNINVIPFIDEAAMGPIKFTPFVEYIYIDRVERSKFQDGTELTYLIDQSEEFNIPLTLSTDLSSQSRLPFKNLVKELFITVKQQSNVVANSYTGNDWFNYQNISNIELLFNGEMRLTSDVAVGDYLQYIQPMNHHTRTPMNNIFCYSFALKPELSVPTGSVNFSRILEPVINITYAENQDRQVRVHATSMNILQIANDLCCLAFK